MFHNITNHAANSSVEQDNNIWVLFGGVGVGKSRTGVELFNRFAQFENKELVLETGERVPFNNLFSHRVHLFVDFERDDYLHKHEFEHFERDNLSASAILGNRVASSFFIGMGYSHLQEALNVDERSKLELEKVLEEMGRCTA